MPNVISVGFHCNTAVANYKLKPLKLYWLFTVFLWTSKLPIMDVSHLLLRIHNNPVSHNSFTLRLWLNQRVQPLQNDKRVGKKRTNQNKKELRTKINVVVINHSHKTISAQFCSSYCRWSQRLTCSPSRTCLLFAEMVIIPSWMCPAARQYLKVNMQCLPLSPPRWAAYWLR